MKTNWLRGIGAAFVALALVQCIPAQLPQETEVGEPEPIVVRPGTPGEAPADAIVLLGSEGADEWRHTDGRIVEWLVEGGVLTVAAGTGNIETVRPFGDVQLHLEWRAPTRIEGNGQGRGNSGVFLQQRYEVQILDSYDNRTYSNGQAASIYKQHIPLVNAMKPPGEWQSYDIVFTGPRFAPDGALISPAHVTVLHNGVLVQNHVQLLGKTVYMGQPAYAEHPPKQPLMLQDHGNPVSFRNIWVRPLD
ncbi:MAG: DUF1080 domain-containing protein [Gammaproteobacteria bacterium]|nr:DUF1080 domain-containing protein [Gammaproteobacteria bacterium]